jgi:hypothetical protein
LELVAAVAVAAVAARVAQPSFVEEARAVAVVMALMVALVQAVAAAVGVAAAVPMCWAVKLEQAEIQELVAGVVTSVVLEATVLEGETVKLPLMATALVREAEAARGAVVLA